jgi:hypothetical protein
MRTPSSVETSGPRWGRWRRLQWVRARPAAGRPARAEERARELFRARLVGHDGRPDTDACIVRDANKPISRPPGCPMDQLVYSLHGDAKWALLVH